MTWWMAVPPNAVIHRTETSEGTSSTAARNSRTVRPRLMRAMNMRTKGDQLIHHAQQKAVQPTSKLTSSRPIGLESSGRYVKYAPRLEKKPLRIPKVGPKTITKINNRKASSILSLDSC